MTVTFLMARHPPGRESPIMLEVIRFLKLWGVQVEIVYPEELLTDLGQIRVDADVYVLKCKTDLSLSFAGALHAAGATILNPYPVTMLMRDKIVSTRMLQAAGLPSPDTYIAAHPRKLAPLLERGPLLLKPYRGSQGRGIRMVRDVQALADIAMVDEPVFVQRYHRPDGPDRKIYCIGGEVFGVLRNWPARSYAEKLGEPFTLTEELHEIALQCGRVFGIELYGLDVITSGGRPYVVDVSSLPGFKGVPDAALRLADYVYTFARSVARRETCATANLVAGDGKP